MSGTRREPVPEGGGSTRNVCPRCHGTGRDERGPEPGMCERCGGEGYITGNGGDREPLRRPSPEE